MVKKVNIMLMALCCFYVSAFSQIYFFCDDNAHSFSKRSNCYEGGSELWTGITPRGIDVYRIMGTDTVFFLSSFGCTQYRINDTSLTFYIWMPYYYESDCLCADDSENPCRPDTTLCDVKLKFAYSNDHFTCCMSDFEIKNLYDSLEFKQMVNSISSPNYLKLSLPNKLCKKRDFHYSYDITTNYVIYYYYNLAVYYLKLEDDTTLSKLTHNLSYVIKHNKWEKDDEPVLRTNYINNFIKYLWPLRNNCYENKNIDVLQKKMDRFITDSYSR